MPSTIYQGQVILLQINSSNLVKSLHGFSLGLENGSIAISYSPNLSVISYIKEAPIFINPRIYHLYSKVSFH